MPGRPQLLMRRVAQLALAVALVAPLLAGAHVHGFAHEASPACSVCTIAKHAPAAVGPVVSTAPVAYRPFALPARPLEANCVGRCWRPAGRAPPSVLPGQLT